MSPLESPRGRWREHSHHSYYDIRGTTMTAQRRRWKRRGGAPPPAVTFRADPRKCGGGAPPPAVTFRFASNSGGGVPPTVVTQNGGGHPPLHFELAPRTAGGGTPPSAVTFRSGPQDAQRRPGRATRTPSGSESAQISRRRCCSHTAHAAWSPMRWDCEGISAAYCSA